MKKATTKRPSETEIRHALQVLGRSRKEGESLLVLADSRGVTVRRLPLDTRVADVGLALDGMVARESGATYGDTTSLTAEEERLLDETGLPDEPRPPSVAHPVDIGIVEYAALLSDAVSVEEAAKLLGVNTSRIRQRLTRERSLYGFKSGSVWRIPKFQFDGRRTVAGIEKVFPNIRPEVDPTGVSRWLRLPHPDLVIGEDEKHVSPLQWLRSGRDPKAVSELAQEL